MLKISNNTIEHIADGIVDLILSRGTIYHKNSEGGGQSDNLNEEFWHEYIKRVDPHEKRYIEIVNSALNKQAKEVFDKIEKYPDDTDKWKFDKKKWIGKFADIEAIFLVKLYKQEGQKAIDEALRLARKPKKAEIPISLIFDIFNPSVKEELLKQTTKFSKGLINTTEEIIRSNIATGLELGESIVKLADRVIESIGENPNRSRAEKIARTETIYASNASAELGYMMSTVVSGKEWVVSRDDRLCDICEEMDGRKELLGESFKIDDIKDKYGLDFEYSEGQMPFPPIHCSCRCTIVPLLFEE
jgi:hypothetical protein